MAKRLSIYCTALALQALILAPAAAQYADDPEATEKVLKGRPLFALRGSGLPNRRLFRRYPCAHRPVG